MTKENQAAIEFVKAKLVCAISQLEKDVGITMAYPISSKILEAVQACDDALREQGEVPIITLTDQRDELRRQLEEVRRQLAEARGALAVETARLNCLFDNHAPDESLANALAIDYLDGDKADEDEITEIRRAWRQAIDAEMRKTDTDASDLYGCDPIREGSKEKPEWEDNPK